MIGDARPGRNIEDAAVRQRKRRRVRICEGPVVLSSPSLDAGTDFVDVPGHEGFIAAPWIFANLPVVFAAVGCFPEAIFAQLKELCDSDDDRVLTPLQNGQEPGKLAAPLKVLPKWRSCGVDNEEHCVVRQVTTSKDDPHPRGNCTVVQRAVRADGGAKRLLLPGLDAGRRGVGEDHPHLLGLPRDVEHITLWKLPGVAMHWHFPKLIPEGVRVRILSLQRRQQ
mmetsp:Transcript_59321/g.138950  ORF Transcript_59321/g.138950 Transcript_59321/m.138950 type:complete len:224 (-) Transcript_59321:23-694(-)